MVGFRCFLVSPCKKVAVFWEHNFNANSKYFQIPPKSADGSELIVLERLAFPEEGEILSLKPLGHAKTGNGWDANMLSRTGCARHYHAWV